MNDCLLIVDVQKGFISKETNHILPMLVDLCKSDLFKHIFLTKFKNELQGPYKRILNWNKLLTSSERKIYFPLPKYAEKIFEKTVYTSVNECLIRVLKENKIGTVFIAGIDTDCCVLTTAVDLFQNNFLPVILSKYCASNGGPLSHTSALIVLKRLIGENQIFDGIIDKTTIRKIREDVIKDNLVKK
jgi:nicotinamidase-related amidase